LAAPALYERFSKIRQTAAAEWAPPAKSTNTLYDRFIADMRSGGLRALFEEKPVLLRLLATLTRQWIDTSRELIVRLDADLPVLREKILHQSIRSRVAKIEGSLSDPHNAGHSTQIIEFEDGSRVVYKPKDLRLDVAWHALIERLNRAEAPVRLRAVGTIARDGYGWTEFVDHAGTDADGCRHYFQRAGAWLALFHLFAANDMHQENMIATDDHPVPIDLETILQAPSAGHKREIPEAQAQEAALESIANSVMMVGLLPAYGRSPDNNVFAIGGMTADWNSRIKLTWNNINTDAMRPAKAKEVGGTTPNLPHVDGRYAKFSDHLDAFVAGFEDYANFLLRQSRDKRQPDLFDGFAGVVVRRVIRATRFYYMLLQRLTNHRSMEDGAIWSAQIDFVARLSDWEDNSDVHWPLQRAERSALAVLNVPHFVSPSDGTSIRDAAGVSIEAEAPSGLEHARSRARQFSEQDIAWQVSVIRQNTASLLKPADRPASGADFKELLGKPVAPDTQAFAREADAIAREIGDHAIRRGPAAAWIGLDWLGDSEAAQLVCLGPSLYNGATGIAVFLAAHAAVARASSSGELALAAIALLRKNLKGRNAPRLARSLGVGGATGLGSVVYALAVISAALRDRELLAETEAATHLFTDGLIAADKQLDVMGGAAGAILGLLRLYRDTQSAHVLKQAAKCGDHLLRQPRVGAEGRRAWVGQGSGQQPLNGMSHGAAGYAYALASLAAATGREEFANAASECIAFEDSSYDAGRHNWPDLRAAQPAWPCQWCHGAPGIGLARIATARFGKLAAAKVSADVGKAVAGAEGAWPSYVDTLCCGTLGGVEFICEAGKTLGRKDLGELAASRMMALLRADRSAGGYRWNSGNRQFNLGLFRGLAGVGYTALRRLDESLPNVLIWE
jgi:type 2 lantibiotic biosynthesis protein LanM